MANAPVLKTGVRKDLGVRIPRPPLELRMRRAAPPGRWANCWANGCAIQATRASAPAASEARSSRRRPNRTPIPAIQAVGGPTSSMLVAPRTSTLGPEPSDKAADSASGHSARDWVRDAPIEGYYAIAATGAARIVVRNVFAKSDASRDPENDASG